MPPIARRPTPPVPPSAGRPRLRVVLGDQLTPRIAALADLDPARDVVLMAEVMDECTYVSHHKQKIALVLSAMRHFAHALEDRGVRVDYVRLDDPDNTQTIAGEVLRAASRHEPEAIVATEPGEWRLAEAMRGLQDASGITTEIRDDTRFLCRIQEFRRWAEGKQTLRMEFFYREMRRRTGLLMDGEEPAGGRWNYDPENRNPLPARVAEPAVPRFSPDPITREVIALVEERFGENFGALETFAWPVTAKDARRAAQHFFTHRLASFGDWQDAMRRDAPHLFHSLLSTSLNLGLLDPLTLCRNAEAAYRSGAAPLNAVEGFIRQIIGWREFVRGIYWLHMPEYGTRNALGATRKLPWFYWSGETRMECLRQVIGQTQKYAHAHHIQRLMVAGNFALLAGLDPAEVDLWYMVVYADAYEWVEMPNTRGMALHADGGAVGSKPYAASGSYISRMSDYCGACQYDVKDATGPRACPFNALYWDFIARHAGRFGANARMTMPIRTLERMAPERLAAIRERATAFLAAMDAGEPV